MTARFKHQEAEWAHRYDPARALLWQMRTGKTRAVVEHACALHDSLTINGVVVVAPNGVHRQWAEEQIHIWGRGKQDGFTWRYADPKNREKWERWQESFNDFRWPWDRNLHWFCVNMEVLIRKEVQDAITWFKTQVGTAMLVIDESHHFARAGAQRTSVARWLGRMFEYRRILTGTPVENSPFQAFSQFEILERGALGHTTFGGTSKKSKGSRHPCPTCGQYCRGFKHEFATWTTERRGGHLVAVLDEYQHLDVLKKRMSRYASVVLREDCEDLPPLQRDHRIVEMTARQRQWWDKVKEKEAVKDKVFDGGAALVKLQQIEGCLWLNEDKTVTEICPAKQNPKMLITADEIEWHDGQVIVWFQYIHEINAVYKFLDGSGIKCGVYSGHALKTRDRDLAAFRAGKLRVLLATPASGGEGRDMSAATKIIWFSQTPDATIRSQANERATKMGAKSVQIVDLLSPVSKYFLSLTERKSTLADDIARRGLKEVLNSLEI